MRHFNIDPCCRTDNRVRIRSRKSNSLAGGIHTSGKAPLRSSSASPLASNRSVLFRPGIRFLTSNACANRGSSPASSIARTSQYQFPDVSSATGDPGGNVARYLRISHSSCSTRTGGSHLPFSSMTTKIEYRACASQPIYFFVAAVPPLCAPSTTSILLESAGSCCSALIRSQQLKKFNKNSQPTHFIYL